MLIYIIVFILAIGLTFIGQKILDKNRYLGIGFFALSVLLLSTFAALRDYSVGADVLEYKSRYYDFAFSYDSLNSFILNFDGEYLFSALTYGIAHIFGSMRVLMFILSATPLIIIYYYGVKYYPKHITLVLAVYLLMFFNTSLNVLRQVAAISCVIPAFFFLQKNKKVLALVTILSAALFHTSAIFMLIIFPINYFAKKKKQIKYYIVAIILFLIFYFSLNYLVIDQGISIGLIEKYAGYIKTEQTNLNIQFFILKLMLFGFITYFYQFYRDDEKCRNYYYFAILDLLFYFFSNFVMFGYRLSYYFVVFYPFFISAIVKELRGKRRILFYGIVGILLILYWIDRNMIVGYDATVPYLLGGGI